MPLARKLAVISTCVGLFLLAVPEADAGGLDSFNRANRRFNFWLFDHVIEPTARGYNTVMPKWGQERLRNVFQNLERPRDIVNSLLQLKPIRAGRHLGSLVIDTTIGVAGAFSLAERWIEPESPETTDETLGVWRIPPGSFLILPVLGETTPRGIVGFAGDTALSPLFWVGIATGVIGIGAGGAVLSNVNLLARQMPERGAEAQAWEAYRDRIGERPPYEEARELFFENLALDVDD